MNRNERTPIRIPLLQRVIASFVAGRWILFSRQPANEFPDDAYCLVAAEP